MHVLWVSSQLVVENSDSSKLKLSPVIAMHLLLCIVRAWKLSSFTQIHRQEKVMCACVSSAAHFGTNKGGLIPSYSIICPPTISPKITWNANQITTCLWHSKKSIPKILTTSFWPAQMFPANSISMFHTEHWCKVDPFFLMRSGFTFCIHCVCFCQHHAKLELPKKLTTTVCFVCLETRLKNYWGQCWGFCFFLPGIQS